MGPQASPPATSSCASRTGGWAEPVLAPGLGKVLIALAGALAPSVWGTFAGYQLQALKQERQRLIDERSTLAVDEAALLSPARLERLARAQRLLEPTPGQVIHLDPRADGSMAMNLHK